jgi:nucleoside-diphosphate-sugar epimerase
VSQANAKTEIEQGTSLVVGGTGLVGGYIVEHLLRRGEQTLALSRAQQGRPASVGFVEIWKSRTH